MFNILMAFADRPDFASVLLLHIVYHYILLSLFSSVCSVRAGLKSGI